MPITVGGGVRTESDAIKLFSNGADKISINSAAVRNPNIINLLYKKIGSQSLVILIEAKKISENKWEVYTENGREKSGIDVFEWIKKVVQLGAGEIIITSIDKEGTMRGPDYKLAEKSSKISTVPILYCGGIGDMQDIINLVNISNIDGVVLASLLHYDKINVQEIKRKLKKFKKVRIDY